MSAAASSWFLCFCPPTHTHSLSGCPIAAAEKLSKTHDKPAVAPPTSELLKVSPNDRVLRWVIINFQKNSKPLSLILAWFRSVVSNVCAADRNRSVRQMAPGRRQKKKKTKKILFFCFLSNQILKEVII